MRKSIEFTGNQLEGKVSNAENKLADTENRIEEIYDYQTGLGYVKQNLIDLEDRSSRNNLRVDSILETPRETWEDFEEKLQQVFQEKLGLECPIEIKTTQYEQWKQSTSNNMQSAKIQNQGKNPTGNKQTKKNKHICQWRFQ